MGIVRRCGPPPRPGPLIQKPTHERITATARMVAASAYASQEQLDRRGPPRIPAAWRDVPAGREHDDNADQVICGCRSHGGDGDDRDEG